MSLRPEIYIAAASPEFNGCRKAVKHALLEIGARPVEQADHTIEYGKLEGVLVGKLSTCAAVIHLAGAQFGAEPPDRTLHAPRRSYTQYEVDVAQKLGLPIYTFAPGAGVSLEHFLREDEEAVALQEAHCRAWQRNSTHFQTFDSPETLGRQVRALRPQLVVRQSLVRLPSRGMGDTFIGRRRILAELRAALQPGTAHWLHGGVGRPGGGVGITTTAVELAWRLHDEGVLPFVFWLPAGPRADFEASLASLARADSLALTAGDVASHRARLEAVLAWLDDPAHAGKYLLVVDGVSTEAEAFALRSFLPHLAGGIVLATGSHSPGAGFVAHAMAPLSHEHAEEFLATRLRWPNPPLRAERMAGQRLTEALLRVPLGLRLLTGHLQESRLSLREYSDQLAKAKSNESFGLATLFEHSVRALDATSRALLRTLACLAPEPAAVPLAVFEQRADWPLNGPPLEALERRGFVRRDESSRTLKMHRRVRELARDRILAGHEAEALGAARVLLDSALHRASEAIDTSVAGQREMLIPHCRALLGQLNGHPLEVHASSLARTMAEWLSDCGRPGEAEVFYRRAVSIEERRVGREAPELAPRLRELAGALRLRRQVQEAEGLLRRALAMDEAAQGEYSADVAADLTLLVSTLRLADRLPEAEVVARRALAIEERLNSPRHPKVAMAVHRLAGVVEAQHRRAEAEALYLRALQIDEEAFGHAHPRLAARLSHLARALAHSRRRDEALPIYQRALASEEKALGPDHLDLAPILTEFASVLGWLDQYPAAEAIARRVCAIYEAQLGTEHAETALSWANVGSLLQAQDRWEEATPFWQAAAHVLALQQRRWRGPHPHLRSVLKEYGENLRHLGQQPAEIEEELARYQTPLPRRERSRFLED